MLKPLLFLSSFVLIFALCACGDDPKPPTQAPAEADAGLDTGEDPPDVEEEVGPPPLQRSTLFGPCVEDSQCPGEGAVCRTSSETGEPGGVCTVPCVDRTPCDFNNVYHHCLSREGEAQRFCERRCLNGLDCGRSAYTCQQPPEGAPEGGVCFGLCATDEQCGDGSRCEPFSGRCTAGEPSTTGAVTGAPCASNEACRSNFCVSETDGWPGGSCISGCILPAGYNNTSFFAGDALPAGDCPGQALCLPLLGSFSRGDFGACVLACDANTDCRTGYICRKSFEGSGGVSNFNNGVCWPGQ